MCAVIKFYNNTEDYCTKTKDCIVNFANGLRKNGNQPFISIQGVAESVAEQLVRNGEGLQAADNLTKLGNFIHCNKSFKIFWKSCNPLGLRINE